MRCKSGANPKNLLYLGCDDEEGRLSVQPGQSFGDVRSINI